jgi:hypothetical protein
MVATDITQHDELRVSSKDNHVLFSNRLMFENPPGKHAVTVCIRGEPASPHWHGFHSSTGHLESPVTGSYTYCLPDLESVNSNSNLVFFLLLFAGATCVAATTVTSLAAPGAVAAAAASTTACRCKVSVRDSL